MSTKTNDYLYELQEIPLSDADILNSLPQNSKLIKYENLENYNTIQQLLPNKLDFCVLFFERKENEGHWCCILRQNNVIEFFDPLGLRPDKQLLFTPKYLRKELNQDFPHLSRLLNKAVDDGFDVIFNSVKYQKEAQGINTCGRHVLCRIIYMLNNPNSTADDYKRFMDEKSRNYGLNHDLVVSRLTE
jgi:hypothetical protein